LGKTHYLEVYLASITTLLQGEHGTIIDVCLIATGVISAWSAAMPRPAMTPA
jgi:hypothetical protein